MQQTILFRAAKFCHIFTTLHHFLFHVLPNSDTVIKFDVDPVWPDLILMQLANAMLTLFDPTLEPESPPPRDLLKLIPMYRSPKIMGCFLPGEGNNTMYVTSASKSPDFAGDLPIFDKIMKISRSPDLEWKSPDFFYKKLC